jgi:hypothetical protein
MATNPYMANPNMQTDWNNAFANNAPGSTVKYGSGNIKFGDAGRATFTNGQGQNYEFSKDMSLDDVARGNSEIANQWKQAYGFEAAPKMDNLAPAPQSAGAPASGNLGMNPWLQQQGAAMQAASNKNLQQNILPGIGQGAMAAGMYGSSRQGAAEGRAMADSQTGLNSALANMYSQSYGQDQQYDLGNRGLQNQYSLGMGNLALGNKQAQNSYDLGLRNNDLGFGQLDANINQQNFQNNLAGANFGLGIYDRMNGYNQQGLANGTQMQQTPMNYFNQTNGNTMAAAGTGAPNQVAAQGNPYMAGAGAGLATYGALQGYGSQFSGINPNNQLLPNRGGQ